MPASSITPLCFILLTCLFGTGCTQTSHPDISRSILQFVTLIDVTLHNVEPTLANSALDQLEKNFSQYHAQWTPWQDSHLTRTNQQLQSQQSFIPDNEILQLLGPSIILSDLSTDLFNPAIGGLIRLWQFHRHDDPDIQPPDAKQIAALVRAQPSLSDLRFTKDQIYNQNTAVDLNFGAYAKGYAIDLSMKYLKSLGIKNAILNAGGDLSAMGKIRQRAWRIGVRHPRKEEVIASLEAHDGDSIFTSGDYERFYIYNGKRYHHILDPRTGYPATSTISVTIIHDNAGVADAAATALFIAGPEKWHNIARRMGIKYVMLIDSEKNIHINPAMLERITFEHPDEHHIMLSEAL